tara:strand:- start:75 stop:242 length:168 start_codon:yes stop_codon:yes gene_type:complete
MYQFGGERGIRTLGTTCVVRRFSKPLVSATHPPLLKVIYNQIKSGNIVILDDLYL